jgi:tRNA-Thr(GGU) m(6)t(6)A37 methyltransferase TsaA
MSKNTTMPELQPVGRVRSSLKFRAECPKQGWLGAPDAWLDIDPAFTDSLEGLKVGDEILLFTWLHEGRRDVQKVHPGHNPDNPLAGVFATRSPDRPNPIGLHRVTIEEIEGSSHLRVRPLEVIDGTPIVDIKPVQREPRHF